jgi:hypothetical protein
MTRCASLRAAPQADLGGSEKDAPQGTQSGAAKPIAHIEEPKNAADRRRNGVNSLPANRAVLSLKVKISSRGARMFFSAASTH